MRPKDYQGVKIDNTASFQKLIEVSPESLPAIFVVLGG
jgi:hypothetical protein